MIATESGAIPEVAGEGALLINPDHLQDLVAVLDNVLKDVELRAFLREKGRANVQRFQWNKAAERLLQIYMLLSVNEV